jgi:peptidyl-prolyl cis-trans isomerase SurA
MRQTLSVRLFHTLLLTLAIAFPAAAQQPVLDPSSAGEELVDRIVAVAGDSVVVYTQIQERLAQMQAQGQQLPQDPQQLRRLEREILEDLVNQLLLLQAAQRDTLVTVSDSRVELALAEAWDAQIQRFGSEAQLRQTLEEDGMTLSQYRGILRDQIRRDLLLERYLQLERRRARFVSVDEGEVREFFEQERHRFGQRPATVTFEQALVFAEASDSAKAEARAEAERILEMIRQGEDFADLARRFSHDPGSRQEGGDLGWYRQGDGLVREFEEVAFQLRTGQISGVVDTPFGAHIIKVERIRAAERKIHHILIAADVTEEDIRSARERAEAIRTAVAGGQPIADFAREQQRIPLPDSLSLPLDQLDQLPSGYASALRAASEDDVLGPLEVPLSPRETAFAVVKVRRIRDAGEFTLDDVRAQIREHLRGEKFQRHLVEQLRGRMHVDIRLE